MTKGRTREGQETVRTILRTVVHFGGGSRQGDRAAGSNNPGQSRAGTQSEPAVIGKIQSHARTVPFYRGNSKGNQFGFEAFVFVVFLFSLFKKRHTFLHFLYPLTNKTRFKSVFKTLNSRRCASLSSQSKGIWCDVFK